MDLFNTLVWFFQTHGIILIFFFGHWYASLYMQSSYLHRHCAHPKYYQASTTYDKVAHILTYLFQGSSYLSPWAYGILHMWHHDKADQTDDAHNPDDGLVKMMLNTAIRFQRIVDEKDAEHIERYGKNVPRWKELDRIGHSPISRIAWGAAYTAFYVIFAPGWWVFLLLPIHWFMGPLHGAIINYIGHRHGYRNFETHDKSRNLRWFWKLLMLGEENHNNHHGEPAKIRFAVKRNEFDLTFRILQILDWLGAIKINKAALR